MGRCTTTNLRRFDEARSMLFLFFPLAIDTLSSDVGYVVPIHRMACLLVASLCMDYSPDREVCTCCRTWAQFCGLLLPLFIPPPASVGLDSANGLASRPLAFSVDLRELREEAVGPAGRQGRSLPWNRKSKGNPNTQLPARRARVVCKNTITQCSGPLWSSSGGAIRCHGTGRRTIGTLPLVISISIAPGYLPLLPHLRPSRCPVATFYHGMAQ